MANPVYGDFVSADEAGSFIGGGDQKFVFGVTKDNTVSTSTKAYNPRQYGVFGANPLMTPKYAVNKGLRDAEFRETLARMFISLSTASPDAVDQYLTDIPQDEQTQALAATLIGQQSCNAATMATGFIDFFLQQVQTNFQEKVQVDEVLGDNYVAWFFGQAPPTFQFSGTLLNSQQDDQTTGFALAYQHLIRGSQLARRGSLLRIRYDNVIVSGAVVQMSSVLNAENELACPFNFSMLVKEYVLIRAAQFVKMNWADFIQLSTSFNTTRASENAVGAAQDSRARATAVTPATLHAESAAGSEPATGPSSGADAVHDLDTDAHRRGQSSATSNVADASGATPQPGPTPYI